MDIRWIDPTIEVTGVSLQVTLDGFKSFRTVAMKYLTSYGLVTPESAKKGSIDTAAWYPLTKWLQALAAIAADVGPNVLFDLGEAVPRNATLPPTIVDIDSTVRSLDVAYHMNHRKAGVVMFDPATGAMLEGIGHYGYSRVKNEARILSVCDNCYPCRFDHGVITAMSRRFEARAVVVHEDTKPCRAKGGKSCTYVISW